MLVYLDTSHKLYGRGGRYMAVVAIVGLGQLIVASLHSPGRANAEAPFALFDAFSLRSSDVLVHRVRTILLTLRIHLA